VKSLLALIPTALLLAGCAVTSSQFHTIDLDGNGALSRGEFTDAVADASFRAYDRNGDDFITLAEWQSLESGGGNDALFRGRDMSRNGRISRQEYRLAAEKNGSLASHFAAYDRNRDGMLSATEARAALKGAPR
jgi:Ca2+-binding EF-hand superfamily protein